MHLRRITQSFLVVGLVAFAAFAKDAPPKAVKLNIQPVDKGWDGDDDPDDVRAVIRSAATEIHKFVPDFDPGLIRVHPRGGPIVLYDRDTDGAIIVKLNADSRRWAQYAYQFAHEFCHILCGYRAGDRSNLWFEETMCETASLFSLRQMAETWKEKAPYSNWKSFAPRLADYAQTRMKEHPLPPDTTLAKWYADNAGALRGNPTDRLRNSTAATALLPIFEADPTMAWSALRTLNVGRTAKVESFPAYLKRWHDATPEAHQPFIRRIAAELGVAW
jgi:hypothetical protein